MARTVHAEAIAQPLTHFFRSESSQQSSTAAPESVIAASQGALDADEVACKTGAPSAMSALRSTSINCRNGPCTGVSIRDCQRRWRSALSSLLARQLIGMEVHLPGHLQYPQPYPQTSGVPAAATANEATKEHALLDRAHRLAS